ncbi:predicted protein [Nematostella vectensis]|uniref:DZIP3-like HEPN domain-containing protein n=1 Tax=Nematostella vectensis TaxID=45351 RepID=A7SY73_NEMVE|nr:predicted protein [Nematostella vectensis]|eukprot:XP_001623457.1 predicted protein [Nematostella vectensis]
MASALSGSEKKDNFQKLSRLLIDGGTKSLRNYFSLFYLSTTLTTFLNLHISTLTGLKGKVLKPHQWDILFPQSGPPTTAEDYDITLLTCLLRNICGLAPPASTASWDKLPPAYDQTEVAQVVRLRHYRNDLYAHIKTTEVETADFNQYWADISAALLSLGGISQVEVDDLYVADLGEISYGKLLKEWWKQDIDIAEKIEVRPILELQPSWTLGLCYSPVYRKMALRLSLA